MQHSRSGTIKVTNDDAANTKAFRRMHIDLIDDIIHSNPQSVHPLYGTADMPVY